MRRIDFTSVCFGFVLGLVAASLINKAIAPAKAEATTLMGNGTSFITATPMPPTYTYEPKPDITAPELSQVIVVLLPALSCRHYWDDCGVVKRIEELPPEVKRHFVRHEN